MRYYIIAGEASGDLHAANLVKQLKQLDTHAVFRGWGGDKMSAQGVNLVKHYKDLAFMGFTEVLMHLRTILNNIKFCKNDVLAFTPDVVILVDYPGFNLRIAQFLKSKGIKVVYYISPQVWAWKQSRVKIIKQCVDLMMVILPFEQDFYRKHHYEVQFVGHPLLDAIAQLQSAAPGRMFKQENELGEKPLVAILPGSRKQEIAMMLPVMLRVANNFPEYTFVVACAPAIPASFYKQFTNNVGLKLVYDQTYALLQNAHAAMVTSGTATLETALFNVPQVVCYKGGKISYLIARSLIKVKYISLVNLIMNREIVKELIQDEMREEMLNEELRKILGGKNRERIKQEYALLKTNLGGEGASAKAAKLTIDLMSK